MPLDEQKIFEKALDIDDAAERNAFLAEACGQDVDAIRSVESLLDSARDAGTFMTKKAGGWLEAPAKLDFRGTSIGNYELLEQIGEGGFGVVYMAEQLHPIKRRVAVKIIKPGMDTKQVIARFEAERQALAVMDHPNIAKVLDAGATADMRPFFVMELVRGIPVTEYCNEHHLSTEQRLRLFVRVCLAIQHAHQKGIIHRDIKPNNILVTTNDGQAFPIVIDFGIAKATQSPVTVRTLVTQCQQFIGTPAYMSPEQTQMNGMDIDTRSDIYSLGVLLYELLTGKTPLDKLELSQLAFEETCRRIRDEDPPPPSKRINALTNAELNTLTELGKATRSHVYAQLRGDLDGIVMKALEKDRARRYESTGALVLDVQRYLNNEPVTAAPPSTAYHLRKFLRRHRSATLTTITLALLLMLGAIVASLGWRQAIAEKRHAVNLAYLADMQAAHQALQSDKLGLARQILDRNRLFAPEADPRHWEWQALWMQCRGDADKVFGVPDENVIALSVSPNGQWIAASGVRNIRVWEVASGQVVHCFDHSGIARFAPAGDVLYTTHKEGFVSAWRLPEFDRSDLKLSHGKPFDAWHKMDISPDGKMLAAFGMGDVTVWDLRTRKLKEQIHGMRECSLKFSRDGSTLAVGSPIRVFDCQTWNEITAFGDVELSGRAAVDFSPDGQSIASAQGLTDPTVMIHHLTDGSRSILEGHKHWTNAVAFSPDGRLIASGNSDRTIRLWGADAPHRTVAILRQHDLGVASLAFSPDGRQLFSGGRDGLICVWNLANLKEPRWPLRAEKACYWHGWNMSQVSCSLDGSLIATTQRGNGRGITLRSTKDLTIIRTLAESGVKKIGARYSPVENLLVIGDANGSIHFINLGDSNQARSVLVAKGRRVFPLQYSRDGERLLVVARIGSATKGGSESLCFVYSVSDQQLISSWSMSNDQCAAMSDDGELVATGHPDGIRLWPVRSPNDATHLRKGTVFSLDFSPDGRHLVAGSIKGRIDIVDVKSKQIVDRFTGHAGYVGALKFSMDGKRLASGGNGLSDALKLWDVESRREIMSLRHDAGFSTRQIEWLPGGNSILMVDGGSVISIWHVPSLEEIHEQERIQRQQSAGRYTPSTALRWKTDAVERSNSM